jgi:hypothetical protein
MLPSVVNVIAPRDPSDAVPGQEISTGPTGNVSLSKKKFSGIGFSELVVHPSQVMLVSLIIGIEITPFLLYVVIEIDCFS